MGWFCPGRKKSERDVRLVGEEWVRRRVMVEATELVPERQAKA
jgi:hypothetical protein